MSHVHDCPRCDGYFECDLDGDDCTENDLCLECQLAVMTAERDRLREELVDLRMRYGVGSEKPAAREEAPDEPA